MNDEYLKLFCVKLYQDGFSVNEIQKAIITNHDIVMLLDDVQSLLDEALTEQDVQKRTRTREEQVLHALCEIKKRLVDTDCSPLHRESEELYQTIWQAIGEHYGWDKTDIEDTEDQD